MPETEIIKELIRRTPERLQDMKKNAVILPTPPPQGDKLTPESLKSGIKRCTACINKNNQSCILGSGRTDSSLMIVDEEFKQGEDSNDLDYLPLELKKIGVVKEKYYRTAAYRLSKDPLSLKDIHVCYPWLLAESKLIKPKLILCQGSKSATILLGKKQPISSLRGKSLWNENLQCNVIYTWSPKDRDFRNSSKKKSEWIEDLKLLKKTFEDLPTV